jgi:hypothetical protein
MTKSSKKEQACVKRYAWTKMMQDSTDHAPPAASLCKVNEVLNYNLYKSSIASEYTAVSSRSIYNGVLRSWLDADFG